MTPLLLPFILLLYAECSKDDVTRFVSRLLLYGHVFAYSLAMYSQNATEALVWQCSVSVVVLLMCARRSEGMFGVYLFYCLLSINIFIYLPLILNDFSVLTRFEWFYNNSNYVMREGTILAVGLSSKLTDKGEVRENKDKMLDLFTLLIYMAEYNDFFSYIIFATRNLF